MIFRSVFWWCTGISDVYSVVVLCRNIIYILYYFVFCNNHCCIVSLGPKWRYFWITQNIIAKISQLFNFTIFNLLIFYCFCFCQVRIINLFKHLLKHNYIKRHDWEVLRYGVELDVLLFNHRSHSNTCSFNSLVTFIIVVYIINNTIIVICCSICYVTLWKDMYHITVYAPRKHLLLLSIQLQCCQCMIWMTDVSYSYCVSLTIARWFVFIKTRPKVRSLIQ